MKLDYKNRIALNYLMATAAILLFVFGILYFLVYQTVFSTLDYDLSFEAEKHTKEIRIVGDSILFKNKEEWEEREHREVQVNPVFLQLMDRRGQIMDKSPNLNEGHLPFDESEKPIHFDAEINKKSVRQVQIPVIQSGEIKGYIAAAVSSEAALLILLRLRQILLGAFFSVLIGLYFISRFLAGRSIKPVQRVTKTITSITQNNLKERVVLPPHQDEIYALSLSFNELLQRIESAIERERQFTSDASHELRTPLAALRGNLEVLIRKPRTQEEYEEKIKYALGLVTQMSETLEQLLILARLDSSEAMNEKQVSPLSEIVEQSLALYSHTIAEKRIRVNFEVKEIKDFLAPYYYTSLILQNLIQNAVKYSFDQGLIEISITQLEHGICLSVQDYGIGIKQEDHVNIFNNFFRSDAMNHKQIPGNGLGLSIVKKCVEAIKAEIVLNSEIGKGTRIDVLFKQK